MVCYYRLIVPFTISKISKAFTFITFLAECLKQHVQLCQDACLIQVIAVLLIQPLAYFITADMKVVMSIRRTDKTNLCSSRPRATIGTTRHAHNDLLFLQTMLCQ